MRKITTQEIIKNPDRLIIGFTYIDPKNKGYLHKTLYSADSWTMFAMYDGISTGNYYNNQNVPLRTLLTNYIDYTFYLFSSTRELFTWLADDGSAKPEKKASETIKTEYEKWMEGNFKKVNERN